MLVILLISVVGCGREKPFGGKDAQTGLGGDSAAGDRQADIAADTTSESMTASDSAADLASSADQAVDLRADGGVDGTTDQALDNRSDIAPNVDSGAGADALIDARADASLLAPTVTASTPAPPGTNVSINKSPTATFSKPMDPSTLTTTTFTVTHGSVPVTVAGLVSWDSLTNTATFTPSSPLDVNTMYTATVTTGAKDLAARALAMSYVWSFTTAACSQAPVALGAAANFAVLAGSTVTNTGFTVVTGDLGVSPGTAVTGFPPGVLAGTQHSGNPTSALAIANLTTAYNTAALRVLCPVSVSGNLGGMTLFPGLYKSTDSLEISSGDLTLDAKGEGEAIFIFQMATTLMATAGRQVLLTNGAKAGNVYWQVGSSATFGTTSAFMGTVMADQAITMSTGAKVTGRLLARIAAVNLDTNMVVKPTP